MLNEKNFLQRALNCYDNPQCVTLDEFKSDLDRFSHIKKIITKYADGTGVLNERLLLNHLVICYNVFGDHATEFILFKIQKKYWGILFPFLLLLDRLPEQTPYEYINTKDVPLNKAVLEALEKI